MLHSWGGQGAADMLQLFVIITVHDTARPLDCHFILWPPGIMMFAFCLFAIVCVLTTPNNGKDWGAFSNLMVPYHTCIGSIEMTKKEREQNLLQYRKAVWRVLSYPSVQDQMWVYTWWPFSLEAILHHGDVETWFLQLHWKSQQCSIQLQYIHPYDLLAFPFH